MCRISRVLLEDVGIRLDAVGRKSHVAGQRTSQTYPFDLCGEVAEIIVREIGHLRLTEPAAVLRVSSDTLRAWERRVGHPHSVCGAAGQRRYCRSACAGSSALAADEPRRPPRRG